MLTCIISLMELVHHHPHYNQNVDVVTEIVTAIFKIVKTRSTKVKQSNRKITNIFSEVFNDNSSFLHLGPPPSDCLAAMFLFDSAVDTHKNCTLRVTSMPPAHLFIRYF